MRMALLIEASQVPSGSVRNLVHAVGVEYGRPIILRAYADWTIAGFRSWSPILEEHGIEPVHHFDSARNHRALMALTVDALDVARHQAVSGVVLVGDLGPALPALLRIRAIGLRIVVVGPPTTPADVRAVADDYVDITVLVKRGGPERGRHRS